jgi:phenylalanyl-tRNA synthetase beta chain
MNISFKWLKQYVAIPENITAEQIAEKLTVATVEVESVKNLSIAFANIVVGEILEAVKHPDADRLTICRVNVGQADPLQIVCGADNVKTGLRVVVALPGAKIRWHGQGEPVLLEKTKVRGIESFGMICAANEVGLGDEGYDNNGIIELTEGVAGENIAKVLEFDDWVIEIDNKSITNRPDLWGHYGVAREVSALFGWKLYPLPEFVLPHQAKKLEKINVIIKKPELCSRYCAAVVSGLDNQDSPRWLRRLLTATGARPINAIVDITNFVMLELGQPMHAFDRSIISGKDIIVNTGYNKDFVSLDEIKRTLDDQILMIADKEKPLAIAGIVGGQSSQINSNTKEIIFESANFDPISVRRSSTRLGLRTDASARFEKSIDPEIAIVGLKRALGLIKTIFPQAELTSNIIDNYSKKPKPIVIAVELDFIRQRLGQDINDQKIISILESLLFKVVKKKKIIKIIVPSWRATKDVSIAEDIVDEVGRVYGFGNIQEKEPLVNLMVNSAASYEFELIQKIKNILALSGGLTEVLNYSFASRRTIELTGIAGDKRLSVTNYINDDSRYLRLSLVENLLVAAENNLRFYPQFSLFEVGRVYSDAEGDWPATAQSDSYLPKQPFHVAGLNVGCKSDDSFFLAKGQLVNLFKQINADVKFDINTDSNCPCLPYLNPNRYLRLSLADQTIGWLAEIETTVANKINNNKTFIAWEVDISLLKKYIGAKKRYQPLPKFPEIVVDLAIVVPEKVLWQEIDQAICHCHPLIVQVELFDVYNIEKVGVDARSLAFHVVLRSTDRTLRQEEAKEARQVIEKILIDRFKAEIR